MRTAMHRTVLASVVIAGTLALPGVAFADNSKDPGGFNYGSPGVTSGNNVQVPIHTSSANPCNQPGGVVGFTPSSGSRCVGQ